MPLIEIYILNLKFYNIATYHQAIIIQLGGNSEQFQTPTVQALRSREIIWIESRTSICASASAMCNVDVVIFSCQQTVVLTSRCRAS